MTTESWDIDEGVTYGAWTEVAPITRRAGAFSGGVATDPNGYLDYNASGLRSGTELVTKAATDYTGWGTIPSDGDEAIRQSAADTARGGVFSGFRFKTNSSESGLADSSALAVWQSAVNGSPGFPGNFNAPYRYAYAASNRQETTWCAPFINLPSPGTWPANAIGYQWENNTWTLVSAILHYEVGAYAGAYEDADASGTVEYRYTTVQSKVTQITQAAAGYSQALNNGTDTSAAPLPPLLEEFEHPMTVVAASTVGAARTHQDPNGFGGWNDVTVFASASGDIDITGQLPQTADIQYYYGGSYDPNTLLETAFAVGFSEGTTSAAVKVNVTGAQQSGELVGGYVGPINADYQKHVTYVLRPPRLRWVFQNQGAGDGAEPLPEPTGDLLLAYGATGNGNGQFFKWAKGGEVTLHDPPPGRAAGPLALIADGRLVCYDGGWDVSGQQSIGYIMDADFQLLSELPSYPVGNVDYPNHDYLDPLWRNGTIFYRRETNKIWIAQWLFHLIRIVNQPTAWAYHEMSLDGIDGLHSVVGQSFDGSDQYNDLDPTAYSHGKFYRCPDKVLRRFDPQTGAFETAWIGFYVDQVMGVDTQNRIILMTSAYDSAANAVRYTFNAVALDDLEWWKPDWLHYPYYPTPATNATVVQSWTLPLDMAYARDNQDWAMAGDTVFYGAFLTADDAYGLASCDLQTGTFEKVFTLPVIQHDGWTEAPAVYGLRIAVGGSVPAVLTAEFTFTSDETGRMVAFDGSASTSSGAPIVKYSWDFGEHYTVLAVQAGDGMVVEHQFYSFGPFDVTLTVTDGDGATASVTHEIDLTGLSIDGDFVNDRCAFTGAS